MSESYQVEMAVIPVAYATRSFCGAGIEDTPTPKKEMSDLVTELPLSSVDISVLFSPTPAGIPG
jgi:hypothetical protein